MALSAPRKIAAVHRFSRRLFQAATKTIPRTAEKIKDKDERPCF
jgi:hypothetical protein